MKIGDTIFPPGEPPRSCIVCGQIETGKGFRMGFAKASHGRKHVNDGTARVITGRRDEYVLTADGLAEAERLLTANRCAGCGIESPRHMRACIAPLIAKAFADREQVRLGAP